MKKGPSSMGEINNRIKRAGGWVATIILAGYTFVSHADEVADYGAFDVNLRSFYFNRGKQDLPSSVALTQALMLRYESSFLNGIVGFNASGFGNLKLLAED
jgi:hypothetical protein